MPVYLDNAATSHPTPQAVIDAVTAALTDFNANPGRSGHAAALAAGRRVLETREAIARLIGAPDPMAVSFAFNCTDALNLAIKGSLRAGDHVVATALEHNSVLRVLATLEASAGIRAPPRSVRTMTIPVSAPEGLSEAFANFPVCNPLPSKLYMFLRVV